MLEELETIAEEDGKVEFFKLRIDTKGFGGKDLREELVLRSNNGVQTVSGYSVDPWGEYDVPFHMVALLPKLLRLAAKKHDIPELELVLHYRNAIVEYCEQHIH